MSDATKAAMTHLAPSEHPHSLKEELSSASHCFDASVGRPEMRRRMRIRCAVLNLRKASTSEARRTIAAMGNGIGAIMANVSIGWFDV
jgi:hypothetical protein